MGRAEHPAMHPMAAASAEGAAQIGLYQYVHWYMPSCVGIVPPLLLVPDAAVHGVVKRKRQTISDACAVCRRSKVKCDEEKPCQRCVKHGRADACISWRKVASTF